MESSTTNQFIETKRSQKTKYIHYYPIFKIPGIVLADKEEAERANGSRLHSHVLNQEKSDKGRRI